jgi:hypothetical protein
MLPGRRWLGVAGSGQGSHTVLEGAAALCTQIHLTLMLTHAKESVDWLVHAGRVKGAVSIGAEGPNVSVGDASGGFAIHDVPGGLGGVTGRLGERGPATQRQPGPEFDWRPRQKRGTRRRPWWKVGPRQRWWCTGPDLQGQPHQRQCPRSGRRGSSGTRDRCGRNPSDGGGLGLSNDDVRTCYQSTRNNSVSLGSGTTNFTGAVLGGISLSVGCGAGTLAPEATTCAQATLDPWVRTTVA